MTIVQFHPSDFQGDLISNALEPRQADETLAKTLFVSDVMDNENTLRQLMRDGVRYLVSFEHHQAFAVLQNSSLAREIAHKVAIPYSVSVFELQNTRTNPDDDDFNISSADLRPDPAQWFETFLNRYTNWQDAWWREVLQNSVDACMEAHEKFGRKGKIECDIHVFPETNEVQVVVSDNGVGMNKDTLMRAFLTPGGSGKREFKLGKPLAGGLGKAKEMLYHAWPWWNVWTMMDGKTGFYVEAKYGPYLDGNIIKSEKRDRPSAGTTVSVLMKSDKCVDKLNLVKFILLSDFPITVTFRKTKQPANGKPELLEQETLHAENKITVEDPVRVLKRSDGSPWANVYHMPHAKKFKEVAVRANGLFLFTAPGHYDFAGKIIIELLYKPKAHQWSSTTHKWELMDPADSASQRITDYGPLEILTESRDSLQHFFKRQLDDFFQMLSRKPEIALKPPRKITRVRVTNKVKGHDVDFAKLFEKLQPSEIVKNTSAAIDKLKNISQKSEDQLAIDFAHKIAKGSSDGEIVAAFSPNELIKLKNIDPKKLMSFLTHSTIAVPRGTEDDSKPTSQTANFLKILEQLEKIEVSAVDTSVDPKLYELYKEILKPVLAELSDEGDSAMPNLGQNIIKMFNWHPDFILSDETDKPTPPASKKFHPQSFTAKEKQIAKFWVEALRLVHMIQGVANMKLEVGFVFENPGSDNARGEYISSDGTEDGREADNIGEFHALLLGPGEVDSNGRQWKHRYGLSSPKDIAALVSIAFHEVAHSTLELTTEFINRGHDTLFASTMTDALALAMRNTANFNKLAKYCSELYPIKGERREEEPLILSKKIENGYYQVACQGVRGRHAKFANIAAALEHADKVIKEKGTTCTIKVYFVPDQEGQEPILITSLDRDSYSAKNSEEFLRELASEIESSWKRKGYGHIDHEDIWKRNRKFLRRRI